MTQRLRKLFGMGYSRWSSCSFCGQYHSQVAKLIDGRKCFICNECVVVCFNLLTEELGGEFQPIHDRAFAIRRGVVQGELSWLKEQFEEGRLSDSVYKERQREIILKLERVEQNPAI